MNYSQLRAFHTVAVQGSFTRAAEKLNVSQPTISDHVKALENDYQVKLFQRHGRDISLTGLGQALLDVSTRLFSLEGECERLLLTARGLLSGHLRVAADSPYLIMPLLGEFHRLYPGIELTLTIGNAAEIRRKLYAQRCDIAVIPELAGDGRLHHELLCEDRISCVVSKEHTWAGRRVLRVQELQSKALVAREHGSFTRATFEQVLQQEQVLPGSVLEVGSREAVREAVAAGLGVGVISESEFGHDPRLQLLQIRHDGLRVRESLACLLTQRELPVVTAFFNMLRQSAE